MRVDHKCSLSTTTHTHTHTYARAQCELAHALSRSASDQSSPASLIHLAPPPRRYPFIRQSGKRKRRLSSTVMSHLPPPPSASHTYQLRLALTLHVSARASPTPLQSLQRGSSTVLRAWFTEGLFVGAPRLHSLCLPFVKVTFSTSHRAIHIINYPKILRGCSSFEQIWVSAHSTDTRLAVELLRSE